MSIQKYDPKLTYEDHPYFFLPVEVIQHIDNPTAGFVWVYLQSKPKDWKVVKEHIKNRFKLGDSKIKQIFAYLAKHKLIEYVQTKGEKGTFGKSDIRVLNGSKFTYPQALSNNNQIHDTAGSKTARAENRTTGFGALHNIENTNNRKSRERAPKAPAARKKRVPLSNTFLPDETNAKKLSEVSTKVGLTEKELIEKFKALIKKKERKSADWQAELNYFLCSERPTVKYSDNIGNKQSKPNQEIRSLVPEWGPGHPSYDALHGARA